METETCLVHAATRLGYHDARLRVVRVSGAIELRLLEARFLRALVDTRSPVEEISIHAFSFWNDHEIMCALENTRAPLRIVRICKYFGDLSVETAHVLLCRNPAPRKIVIQGAILSEAVIGQINALGRISDEQAAILRIVGQFAARTLRPMIAPTVHCARSSECACEL
jgi:hypothetical protein